VTLRNNFDLFAIDNLANKREVKDFQSFLYSTRILTLGQIRSLLPN